MASIIFFLKYTKIKNKTKQNQKTKKQNKRNKQQQQQQQQQLETAPLRRARGSYAIYHMLACRLKSVYMFESQTALESSMKTNLWEIHV